MNSGAKTSSPKLHPNGIVLPLAHNYYGPGSESPSGVGGIINGENVTPKQEYYRNLVDHYKKTLDNMN
jgi:hypothetical protein